MSEVDTGADRWPAEEFYLGRYVITYKNVASLVVSGESVTADVGRIREEHSSGN